jgi:multiple sugar transport system substrate-binding protein
VCDLKKYIKGIGIILIAVLMILTGCSKESSSGSESEGLEKVKMVFWPGPESDAMQKVVDAYNKGKGKEDGVEVEMVLVSRDGTYEKEATMMNSKSKEVDMYFTASYIIGQHAPHLEPLDGDIPFDKYLDVAIESLKVDGKTLAIPMDASTHFMFYRKDLIEELLKNTDWQNRYKEISKEVVGKELAPKDPANWDWDDFTAASAFFTKKYNDESPTEYGTALQLKNLMFNTFLWDNVLWSNGGNWVDSNGKADLKSDAAKKAMEIYSTIYKKGLTSPNSTVAEFPEAQAAMNSGNAALLMQWGAGFAELDDPAKSPKIAGKVGVAPIPGQKIHVHGQGIGLNKYSEHKEASLKWMNYLTTIEANEIYAQAGGITAVPEVMENMTDRPLLGIISKDIQNYGYSEPTLPGTYKILNVLAENLSPGWIGEQDIDTSLDKAQKALEEVLSE